MAIFSFLDGGCPPSWIFKFEILTAITVGGPVCIMMSDFVLIGQVVSKI